MAKTTVNFVSQMDQDWEEAREWFDDAAKSSPEVLCRLTYSLADDSARDLVRWMRSDRTIADVVQRLALLALHELNLRQMPDDELRDVEGRA